MPWRKEKIRRELAAFLRQYRRPSDPHTDPNDRRYDRKLEERIKRMDPVELDEIMRDEDDD